jgi:hypothetical protein
MQLNGPALPLTEITADDATCIKNSMQIGVAYHVI